MKRFHVHVGVSNLSESIAFYTGLFGVEPTVRKPGYAKWMVEDPRINFAISQRSAKFGVNHLGLQVDEADELPGIKKRFEAAGKGSVIDEMDVNCCYARSDKHWVTDPQGVAWEGWHSLGQVEIYEEEERKSSESGCCGPSLAAKASVSDASTNKCCG
ncbi:MAG TPA: ArsI/CadI family heavy metal resistance metalloenzyme [Casimicrobiaceae bacterium]|nr:ArsI/CadI family heavy metal resistance metalloenzyme [Casimicrobiaceae bacterium]